MKPHTSSQRIYDKEPQNILLQPRILKSYVVETKKHNLQLSFWETYLYLIQTSRKSKMAKELNIPIGIFPIVVQ